MPLKNMRIALAQINLTVGDLSGNCQKIISYIQKARARGADIIAFPELALTGYPPEDLLLKHQFVRDNIHTLNRVKEASTGIITIAGFVDKNKGIYNAAAVISDGHLVDIYHKMNLPNYGVFDEHRYFQAGRRVPVYTVNGVCFGVNVCEDIWLDRGPAKLQALAGAGLIVNINASPFHMGKMSFREQLVQGRAGNYGAALAYVNLIGGQDELVFDGGSLIVDKSGQIVARAGRFSEEMIIADVEVGSCHKRITAGRKKKLDSLLKEGDFVEEVKIQAERSRQKKKALRRRMARKMSPSEEVYKALILGTGDYVLKNGFTEVLIGMSGGIDSALVTTIAVDALGKESVHGLFMPSLYTSEESRDDAAAQARNLGISMHTLSVDPIFNAYLKTLKDSFKGRKTDITEENLQARIRGNILMAFSNKFGWLVLTTGNKSEMSVGYATLYGDMAGGFAVIKDVPKTLVYDLCRWRNKKAGYDLIPESILQKEPTAELRPDQKDTDSLPPYPVLDPVLKAYVEDDLSYDEIEEMGCDIDCTKRVIAMIDRSEYKRRQAPPGVKITPRAFGRDRRFPITNKYRNY